MADFNKRCYLQQGVVKEVCSKTCLQRIREAERIDRQCSD